MNKELTKIEQKKLEDKALRWFLLVSPFVGIGLAFLKTQHPEIWGPLSAIGLVLVVLSLYFLPSTIAKGAKHPQTTAIFLLNLLLGWTFLGWVGALVWAAYKPKVSDENGGRG